MKRTIKAALLLSALAVLPRYAAPQAKPGADGGAPFVAEFLSALPLSAGVPYVLAEGEVDRLFGLAARKTLNVFELLDGAYRYLEPRGLRVVLSGAALRRAAKDYDVGGERIEALLPFEKTERVELGAGMKAGEEAMDVYLSAPHERYIEIGTALMERRFGFKRLAPNLFDEAYGVRVKRFPVNTELDKLELYAPVKGAIYVKALSRPKRWNLNPVSFR